ncbi:hypothetical protein CHCC14437_4331 [Bacillus licheniformis]|nr:hypothetical protein CHCC14437_4331 [Bacillus licheniformis]
MRLFPVQAINRMNVAFFQAFPNIKYRHLHFPLFHPSFLS